MLKLYDYFDEVMASKAEHREQKLRYYASDIMDELGYERSDDVDSALKRTFMICQSLQISIPVNFRQVYRFDGEKILKDWKLSPLACYIMIMNGNPCNPNVARAQLLLVNNSAKA